MLNNSLFAAVESYLASHVHLLADVASASVAEAIFCTFFVFGGTKWACLLVMIHILKGTGCPEVLPQGCSKVMRGQGGGSESPLNTC